MTGGKYIIATKDNAVQIAVRNILNPNGYIFLEHCRDAVALMRLIRSFHPEFVVVDTAMQLGELRGTLETVDDEMLCAIILLGDYDDPVISTLMERSNAISSCPKPPNRELLLHTADMAVMNFKRVLALGAKLRQMTDNYESRKQIDVAKALLMEHEGLNEKEAYEKMRRRSMDERLTMRTVADLIIHSYKTKGKH
ncbi:MAG TPA: ANTAR domain-containing protein [Clostridia bacterium]|nr:ANTAR domain-containing protein [Clostridia bacterium]